MRAVLEWFCYFEMAMQQTLLSSLLYKTTQPCLPCTIPSPLTQHCFDIVRWPRYDKDPSRTQYASAASRPVLPATVILYGMNDDMPGGIQSNPVQPVLFPSVHAHQGYADQKINFPGFRSFFNCINTFKGSSICSNAWCSMM